MFGSHVPAELHRWIWVEFAHTGEVFGVHSAQCPFTQAGKQLAPLLSHPPLEHVCGWSPSHRIAPVAHPASVSPLEASAAVPASAIDPPSDPLGVASKFMLDSGVPDSGDDQPELPLDDPDSLPDDAIVPLPASPSWLIPRAPIPESVDRSDVLKSPRIWIHPASRGTKASDKIPANMGIFPLF
ncbi:MAG: hypothetical protein ACRDOK_18835 [Streptosporangiaceae bacterium]